MRDRSSIQRRPPPVSPTDPTCRTCKDCRQRKVKCNGHHPRCAACQRKNIECVYPRDERRTPHRAKKANVRALEKQVEVLQERLGSVADSSAAARSLQHSLHLHYHTSESLSSRAGLYSGCGSTLATGG
ncbi:Zn(II)2Cys6 transcription factor domain-containing protein [Aspergillus aculeatinus CBS 121060]|uniref:Uncharacterized protein n=1 Tax=Aspergillus aculeatinus CBS 121060 TaxID=1448322 RepID=A0ACD1GXN4_9EURO|nr:hypothetical protein BO66DRAFT_193280 [Aspergillus aculeatinus CBS 121060]RAH65897.1 hypothetical protein BO66DRAFT_193280 [Aspergillus aculeatinus CBS 121060]